MAHPQNQKIFFDFSPTPLLHYIAFSLVWVALCVLGLVLGFIRFVFWPVLPLALYCVLLFGCVGTGVFSFKNLEPSILQILWQFFHWRFFNKILTYL